MSQRVGLLTGMLLAVGGCSKEECPDCRTCAELSELICARACGCSAGADRCAYDDEPGENAGLLLHNYPDRDSCLREQAELCAMAEDIGEPEASEEHTACYDALSAPDCVFHTSGFPDDEGFLVLDLPHACDYWAL